jgi:outer membrane protein assembly factor BamB
MTQTPESLVFIGIKGSVIAIDRTTGSLVWNAPLKGSDFVTLLLDGDDLFASARGELFCLDSLTGRIRWNNGLKGMGWGLMSIATQNGSSSTPAMAEHHKRQQASADASTGTT